MYKIYDSFYEREKFFASWWVLIEYIIIHKIEGYISHNENDCKIYTEYIWDYTEKNYVVKKREKRNIFVYNEDAIVNLSEIREGIKNYHPVPKKESYHRWRKVLPYEYRVDPVPFIHSYSCGGYYRGIKKNKNYILGVISYMDDSRIRKQLDRVSDWGDDHPRNLLRNWKEFRRTQWK